MTFRSKVLARTKKYDGQTDGRTDGHPKPIGPQPFGLGPNNLCAANKWLNISRAESVGDNTRKQVYNIVTV